MSRYYPPSDIKLYKSEETTVEARQWDGTKGSTYELLWWTEQHNASLYQINPLGNEKPTLQIGTPKGIMTVQAGDYVTRTITNEFYTCHEETFLATYKRVKEPDASN